MELEVQTELWYEEVRQTLLNIENRLRIRNNQPPHTMNDVWVDLSTVNRCRLLVLKVWTVRYNVGLEFILEFLLRLYADVRKRHQIKHQVTLGIPLILLTGPASRMALEGYIKRLYPAGENLRDAAQQLRQRILDVGTPSRVSYATESDVMAQNYQKAILARRREAVEPTFRRPWRSNPF
jgi:hypothetical protein